MKFSEFTEQPSKYVRGRIYTHADKIPSPLGDFTVKILCDVRPNEVTDEMMTQLTEFVSRFKRDKLHIRDLTFQQYLEAVHEDMFQDSDELPNDLTKETFIEYLSSLALLISFEKERTRPVYPRVYIRPHWDEEHCLYYAIENENWVQVDC